MSQSYPAIPSTMELKDSRVPLTDRDDALRSMFGGASAPPTPVLHQLWFDETAGVIKICTNAVGPVWTEFFTFLLSVNANAVGNSHFRQSAGYSVPARASGTTGNVADVTASANDRIFLRQSNALLFAQLTFAMIASGALATPAEYRAETASKLLSAAAVWDAAEPVTLTDAATIAVDLATMINAKVTLGGNRTLGQPANAKPGQSGYIEIIQPASGGPRTLDYHADWQFAGTTHPVLSTAANARDVLAYAVLNDGKVWASLSKALG